MKNSKNLKLVRSYSRLESAWAAIRENARTSKSADVRNEVEEYAVDAGRKLRSLSRRLAQEKFVFPKAKGIPIPKKKGSKKIRPIVLAPVESRIVQRAILETLVNIPQLKPYFENAYSFGGIKKRSGQTFAAVPAAIGAVLDAFATGGKFVAFADIRSFFTRISKDRVCSIIGSAINDDEFLNFIRQAIDIELENMAELGGKASEFPIYEIGVAQGNCLSPLLGNIVLHEFDRLMNEGDCACFRYIDDFIIVAPTRQAAMARMKLAIRILGELKMELSPEKSSKDAVSAKVKFEFLGVELNNGFIRPSSSSRGRILTSLENELKRSGAAMINFRDAEHFESRFSLAKTLKRATGMVEGWGKHYRFCNDSEFFKNLDDRIGPKFEAYIGTYKGAVQKHGDAAKAILLGLPELVRMEMKSLSWPVI